MNHWDEKIRTDEYVYGVEPNEGVRVALGSERDKSIALLAGGEGRNAVYLGKLGNNITTYDLSKEGIEKTKRLAGSEGVAIDTHLQDITVRDDLPDKVYDISFNIFGHVPKDGKVQKITHITVCVKRGK